MATTDNSMCCLRARTALHVCVGAHARMSILMPARVCVCVRSCMCEGACAWARPATTEMRTQMHACINYTCKRISEPTLHTSSHGPWSVPAPILVKTCTGEKKSRLARNTKRNQTVRAKVLFVFPKPSRDLPFLAPTHGGDRDATELQGSSVDCRGRPVVGKQEEARCRATFRRQNE